MTIYTSISRPGFYDGERFGEKQIQVPDPAWVRPTFSVTLQPGENLNVSGHDPVTNDTDAPLVVSDVPDMTVEHPLVKIDNPDTKLPSDAVAITSEMHAALQAAPYGIDWSTSPPTAKPQPVVDAAQAWSAYQAQAATLLNGTHAEYVALTEYLVKGESKPAGAVALVDYRRALRAIVSASGGNPNLPLPVRP